MTNPRILFYTDSDRICRKEWRNDSGYHNEDGPAWLEYSFEGNLIITKYFINGYLHRDDGPAVIEGNEFNNSKVIGYFKHGKFHRMNGPAYIQYDGGKIVREIWYINGKNITKFIEEKPELLTDATLRKILL